MTNTFGAGLGTQPDRLVVDAPVDRQQQIVSARGSQMPQAIDGLRLEFLPAKPGRTLITSTRSQSCEIGLDGLDRRGRIERQSGDGPKAADLPQQRPRIVDRFDVDRQQVGPRLAESLQVAARFGNHQVHVQRQAGRAADGLDHGKTEADVGHEMPVHDVQVQDSGLRPLPSGEFPAPDEQNRKPAATARSRGPTHRNSAMISSAAIVSISYGTMQLTNYPFYQAGVVASRFLWAYKPDAQARSGFFTWPR